MSKYLLPFVSVKYLYIFSLRVLLNLSITTALPSLKVWYNSIPLLTKNFLKFWLTNSLPASVHSLLGFLSFINISNASIISLPVLVFNGIAQANFENMSMTVSKYLYPLFCLENGCMSTKSADQISSIL